MITKALKVIKQIFIPRSEFEDEVVCAIDDEVVDCKELQDPEPSYIGVPAPVVLQKDSWFGTAPEHTEKQKEKLQQEAQERLHDDLRKEHEKSKESENIHQEMYELASKNWNTVSETQGGSENFHGGPGGWTSGTGMGQFQS